MEISGITSSTEKVKFAVTMLEGKALLWWRGIADKPEWRLGVALFTDWCDELVAQF